jgi:tRNA (guanine-N7-)-methyltransferase
MKNKLERFRIVAERDNVLERGKDIFLKIKGNWCSDYFKNSNPITVELACGRGEYTIGLAEKFSQRNHVGVDIKGDRIWKGSSWAIEKNLKNVGFLRTNVLMLMDFFQPGEIDELWITFPDPRPRKRDVKRRLTNPRFLEIYKPLIRPGGYLKFKTDNTALFNYTLEELSLRDDIDDLRFTHDLYADEMRPECWDIKTRYEEMFTAKGESIKYLRFKFKNQG